MGTVGFVITRGYATWFALVALVIPLGFAQWMLWPVEADASVARRRRRGIGALVMGKDGRTSTSKVQVVLWTFVILYAFAFLLLWGRNTGCSDSLSAACKQAAVGHAAFTRAVNRVLQPEYYVLLGFPLTAAIAAKALTTKKLETQQIKKSELDAKTGPAGPLRELVGNDENETDLLDFQYFAFNLLALAYFVIEFLAHPAKGLPVLPPTLVALSGAAAAAYTTKKALETTVRGSVSAVVPRRIARAEGTRLTIVGSGFGDSPNTPDGHAQMLLDGALLRTTHWSPTRVTVTVTDETLATIDPKSTTSSVTFLESDGVQSDPFAVELFRAPASDGGVA